MTLIASSSRPAFQHAARTPLLQCRVCSRPASTAAAATKGAAFTDSTNPPQKGAKRGSDAPIVSAAPLGMPLKGISVFKSVPDPVAKADEDYPPWLWTVLDTKTKAELADQPRRRDPVSGKLDFAAERKRLRAINILKIKADNFLKTT